jgi:hypothetical protein
MKRILLKYTEFLHSWPYLSQSVTAGTMWFAGDLISQKLTKNQEDAYDWKRAGVMTAFGLFLAGPLYTFWYGLLDQRMAGILSRWVSILKTMNSNRVRNTWHCRMSAKSGM